MLYISPCKHYFHCISQIQINCFHFQLLQTILLFFFFCICCIYNYSQSEGVPGWVQLSSVRDSFLVWGDSHLDPSFSGIACPSWCWKGSSLLSLAAVSRTAPSTAPHCGTHHPAMSHLERESWPQLPLEVVSAVPHLAPRVSRELTS